MTMERLESGMMNEMYYDGEDAVNLFETGHIFVSDESVEEYWEEHDEPVKWEVDFSTGNFVKMYYEEITAYMSLDGEGEVDWIIAQFP